MDLVELGFSVDTRGIEKGTKELDKLEAAEKKVGAEGKKSGGLIAKSFNDGAESLENTTRAGRGLTSAMNLLGGAISAVGVAALITATKDFQKALAQVSTLVDTTTFSMSDLSDEALRQAMQFGSMPTDNAKAFYNAISAGANTAEKATEALTAANKLAIGGVTNTTVAIDGLTSVMNAYAGKAGSFTDISDSMFIAMKAGKTTIDKMAASIGDLAPIASQAGASFDEVMAATAALTKGGVTTATAMVGLKGVMTSVIKPSSEAEEMAKKLGLQFDAAALKSKGLAGFLKDLGEKTKGSTEVLAQLFGGVEALTPVLALTGSASKDFTSTLEAMIDKAGATDEAFKKLAETADFQARRIKAGLAAAWISFSKVALDKSIPTLTVLADAIENVSFYAKELTIALTALALFMARNMIKAGVAFIANQALVAASLAKTSMQALAQVPAMGKASLAMSVATGAARGLAGVMALIGGPVGLFVIAAASAFAYREEIRELTSGVKMSKEQEEARVKILADVKQLSIEAAGATKELSESKRKDAEASYQASQAELARLKTLAAASRQRYEAAKAAEESEKAQGLSIRYRSTENMEAATLAARNANNEYQAQLDLVREIDKELQSFGKKKVTIQGVNVESGVSSSAFKTPDTGTVDAAAKAAKNALLAIRTEQEKYNDSLAQYGQWLDTGKIDTAEHTKLVAAAKAQLDKANAATEKAVAKTKELTSEQRQAAEATRRAQEANEIAQKSLGKTDEQVRALVLSYKDGYTQELAKAQARAEFAKKADDALRDSQERLSEQNKRDAEALKTKNAEAKKAVDLAAGIEQIYRESISSNSLGKINEQVEALSLTMSGKYNKTQSESIAKNKGLADTYKSIQSALQAIKDPTNDLSSELKTLNEQWQEGQISATEYYESIEDAVDKSKKLVAEAKKVNEELEKNTKQMSNDLVTALNESLLSGDFRSLGDKLNDIFASDVFAPIMQGSLKTFGSAFANSMKGLVNNLSGSIGGGSIFSNVGKGLSSLFDSGKLTESLSQIDFGGALDAAFENSGIGSTLGGAIGSIFGPIGTAAGSALGSIIESAFGGKTQTVNTGVRLGYDGGLTGQNFADKEKKRSFWRGTKRWTEYSELDADIDEAMSLYFGGVEDSVEAQAALLGINSGKLLEDFTAELTRFRGDDVGSQVQEWADGVASSMYDAVFSSALGGYRQTGEEMSETVTRLLTQVDSVVSGLQSMGTAINGTMLEIVAISDGLVAASGDLETLKTNMQSYYDVVFTSDEQVSLAKANAKSVIDAFNAPLGFVGDAVIDTAAELQAYVDAQDLSTTSGQEATANAYALATAIATYSGTAEEAAEETAALEAEIAALGTAAEQSLNLISTLATDLYGSIDERYSAELARYQSLKNGAEDLRDAVNGFTDSVSGTQDTLADSQRNYNELLAKAQSGDTSVIPDLMTAADNLKSALSENYAGGAQAAIGTQLIAGQLSQVASLLDMTAGDAPIDPSATDDRASLAQELAQEIAALGLAEDKSVFDLMDANGIYLKDLASDFGVDVYNMTNETLSGLDSLAQSLHVDTLDLAERLGVDISSIGNQISSNVSGLTTIPDHIKNGLAPYLSAIESANDSTSLNNAVAITNKYLDTLPVGFGDSIRSELLGIESVSGDINASVIESMISTSEGLELVKTAYGIDTKNLSAATTQGLQDLARDLGSDVMSISDLIGLDIRSMSASLIGKLQSLEVVTGSVKTGLAPYLAAIQKADTSAELNASIALTNSYLNTLDADTAAAIRPDLLSISSAAQNITSANIDTLLATENGLQLIKDTLTNNAASFERSNASILTTLAAANNSNSLALISELGLSVDDLAKSFNIDLTQLNNDTAIGLRSLSSALGMNSSELIGNLNGGFSTVSSALYNDVVDSIGTISDDTRTGLAPYLTAIKNSNNSSSLVSAINETSAYINTLPIGIRSQLQASFNGVISNTGGIIDAVMQPDDVQANAAAIASALRDLGLAEDESVFAVMQQNGINLQNLATDFGVNISNLPSNLQKNFNTVSGHIITQLTATRASAQKESGSLTDAVNASRNAFVAQMSEQAVSLPVDIQRSLAPHLSAIEKSNDSQSLLSAIDSASDFINTLPGGIKESLHTEFQWVVVAQGLASSAIKDGNNLIYTAIDKSTDTAETSARIIAENIRQQASSDDLIPYLSSIESATNYDELTVAVNDLLDSNSDGLSSLLAGFNVNISRLDSSTLTGLSELAMSLGTDSVSLGVKLGSTIERLGSAFASDIESQSSSLPQDISAGLAPYLESIESAGSNAELNDSIVDVARYVNELPADIRDNLHSKFQWMVTAVGLSSNSVTGAVNQTGKTFSSELLNLADTLGVSFIDLANELGVDINSLGGEIADSVSGMTEWPEDIANQLAPYLEAIKLASSTDSLKLAVDHMAEFIQSLPNDLKSQLTGDFLSIVGAVNEIEGGIPAESLTQIENELGVIENNTGDTVTGVMNSSDVGVMASIRHASLWNTNQHLALRNLLNNIFKTGAARLENDGNQVIGKSIFEAAASDASRANELMFNSFDVGSDRINGDQLAMIHDNEAIFTATESDGLRKSVTAIMSKMASDPVSQAPVTVNVNNGKSDKSEKLMQQLVDELKATKAEIKEMKDDQKIVQREINKNSRDTSRTLDRWETIGLPLERT